MTDKEYSYVPAAFINAIAEEGTKAEAVEYLQKQWNENCALRAELARRHSDGRKATPDGWVMVPRELTAENGAKTALSGDFSEAFDYMDDEGDECTAHIQVSWTTIKEIHRAMVKHFSEASALPSTASAIPVPASDGRNEELPDQSFVEMLWKWFEDRGVDLRSERRTGLTADDFKIMLDEHEAALIPSDGRNPTPDEMGRAFYLARHENDGAKWEANDHKMLWVRMAQRYHELLT